MKTSRTSSASSRRAGIALVVGATVAVGLSATTASAQPPAAAQRWTPIFDGRTLAGWKGAAQSGIEDGALVLRGGSASDALCTERSYGDFVLRFRTSAASTGARADVLVRARQPEIGAGATGPGVSLALASAGTLRDARGRVLARADSDVIGRIRDTAQWVDHVDLRERRSGAVVREWPAAHGPCRSRGGTAAHGRRVSTRGRRRVVHAPGARDRDPRGHAAARGTARLAVGDGAIPQARHQPRVRVGGRSPPATWTVTATST